MCNAGTGSFKVVKPCGMKWSRNKFQTEAEERTKIVWRREPGGKVVEGKIRWTGPVVARRNGCKTNLCVFMQWKRAIRNETEL